MFGELIGKSDVFGREPRRVQGGARQLSPREVKAATMQVASDPSGGYWVTPDTSGKMVQKIYESTPMRQLANVVTIGTDALEGPIDNGEATPPGSARRPPASRPTRRRSACGRSRSTSSMRTRR
jgi:HK97 family phage major capsid protein